MLFDLVSNAGTIRLHCCQPGCPGAAEWIQDDVAHKGEHADQPESDLLWKQCWMPPVSHLPRHIGPDLPEPPLVILFFDNAQRPLGWSRLSIGPRSTEDQDIFDLVLDDRVRLVGLAQKRSAVPSDLGSRVGNLVPKNRDQVIETNLEALPRDVSVHGNHAVASRFAPGQANVSDHNAQPAARNQKLKTARPDPPKLAQELLVVRQVTQLRLCELGVLLKVPVGRGGHYQVNHRVRTQFGHHPGVPQVITAL